jgi:hypothetical protein
MQVCRTYPDLVNLLTGELKERVQKRLQRYQR